MGALGTLFTLLIPTVILLHLLVAPYTKVEESFNIQATHDIINYSTSPGAFLSNLEFFDHVKFPGAVPRTFVGAFALATISKPIIAITSPAYAQFIVRAVLGLFNAFALLKYRDYLAKAYGRDVGRWYILLQASQFHVIFYASRTLPNMFAFGLTTIALGAFLPSPTPVADKVQQRQKLGIFLFVAAGVVFRSEVALLLVMQLLHLLIIPRMSLQQMVPAGLQSALLALAISIPIDSFFWQKPLWPELWGFYYNAIQGKSAEWGTSPYLYYFKTILPRLLLNPLIMTHLIPFSFLFPLIRRQSSDLVISSILFIAIYSLQPHKESRFIIYAIPPLTAAASISASYIWTHRSKALLYRVSFIVIILSILASFAASTLMLLVSSLNYPGGEAISSVRSIIAQTRRLENSNSWETTYVHMDVLSCMTGVTRFQEIPSRHAGSPALPKIEVGPANIVFDKEENEEELLKPAFWEKFEYALMEEPGKAIGKWEVIDTIYGLAGYEFLRPGQGGSSGEHLENVYAANNVTKDKGVVDSKDVKEAVKAGVDIESVVKNEGSSAVKSLADLKSRLLSKNLSRYEIYKLVKDTVRSLTGGYWIGPRMSPAIRVLKRVKA